jgi:hypothetical protein
MLINQPDRSHSQRISNRCEGFVGINWYTRSQVLLPGVLDSLMGVARQRGLE